MGEASTYDAITRRTAFNVIDAIEKKQATNLGNLVAKNKNRYPFCFVSAAEAGWPDVPFGKTIDEKLAPAWLNKYLLTRRAVEARLKASDESKGTLRAAIYRPSLIWDWSKLDVLPAIPLFNLAGVEGVVPGELGTGRCHRPQNCRPGSEGLRRGSARNRLALRRGLGPREHQQSRQRFRLRARRSVHLRRHHAPHGVQRHRRHRKKASDQPRQPRRQKQEPVSLLLRVGGGGGMA